MKLLTMLAAVAVLTTPAIPLTASAATKTTPVSAARALPSSGICTTELGCRNGEDKCATATIGDVSFTCYTTIQKT